MRPELPPQRGWGAAWLTTRTYNVIARWLGNIRWGDGMGFARYHEGGINLSLNLGAVKDALDIEAGTRLVPIRITASGTAADICTADVYADGTDTTATETGVTVRVLQIHPESTIPTGTDLPAWKQPWGATDQYTVDVPRFL